MRPQTQSGDQASEGRPLEVVAEIRVCLSACHRDRVTSQGGSRSMAGLLQLPAAPLEPWRLTPNEAHANQTAPVKIAA